MHHPTDRITHTTAFVTSVVEHWLEREIAQWLMIEFNSKLTIRHSLHSWTISLKKNVLCVLLNKYFTLLVMVHDMLLISLY